MSKFTQYFIQLEIHLDSHIHCPGAGLGQGRLIFAGPGPGPLYLEKDFFSNKNITYIVIYLISILAIHYTDTLDSIITETKVIKVKKNMSWHVYMSFFGDWSHYILNIEHRAGPGPALALP